MRIPPLILVALSLAGCEERDGRADTIPLFYSVYRDVPTAEMVAETEDIFGLEVVEEVSPYGAIQIYLYDDRAAGDVGGETHQTSKCTASLWTIKSGLSLAHEVGHALGLEHTDIPDNLMNANSSPAPQTITDEQLDDARHRSWVLQECRREL